MKILVTGSAGLIGSHLVDYLMAQGHTVFGCDNLAIGSIDNVSQMARKNFWHIDLKQKKSVEFLFRILKPEVVFHCAAYAHEGLSEFVPKLITENGLDIALNVLVPAIRAKVKRFVFFSSVAVYGDQQPPFSEKMTPKPVDIYGLNKLFVEDALKTLSSVHDFEYCIIRAFNVFGERQLMTDPYRGVAAIFMNKLLHNEPFYIYGDGEQQRGFTYIKDILPYITMCGLDKKTKNETFNIGGSNVYTVNDLAQTVLKVANSDIKPINLPERVHDVKMAFCDTTKAKEMLGLEENTTLEEAVTNMWNYAKKLGPQEPKYLDHIELPNSKMPKNWVEKK